jgi:sigma-B regulation protein RsbU (phosphoserine phosphatase)
LGVQAGPFQTAELAYLARAINSMSFSLAEADRERRTQMAKARRIQEHLLPGADGAPGLRSARLFLPAADVGGDYFDIFRLSDQSWLSCMADVTGHGVSAAMGAVVLKALLLEAAERHTAPGEILGRLNDRFAAVSLPEDFASMFVARWYPGAARLEYASAGHETAYFLSASGVLRELPSTGPLLGLQEGGRWEEVTVPVAGGDRLLLVTDGVTETRAPDGRLFGRQQLAGLFSGGRAMPLDEMVRQVDRALAAHRANLPAGDDVTLLAVEFTEISRAPSGS